MIDNMSYEEILETSAKLNNEITIIKNITKNYNVEDLNDFVSTVEAYVKYLESLVELNKDADEAIKDIQK